MQHINCLPGQPERRIEPTFSQEESWIISHTGGILHTDTNLGQIIKEGEKLGSLSDPFGTGDKATVRSPHDGIIVGINTTPLIHEGLPLFKVASFIDDKRAETAIGKWNDQQDDDFLS
jgi:predicted deacylase